MPHYKYLIVGGGMTADSAVSGIREVDSESSIGLISSETDAPYDRPPLSKGLWKGKPMEDIFRGTDQKPGVELRSGRTAITLDAAGKKVTDDKGDEYTYDKLLFATGGSPRTLPFGGDDVIYFRTLADYQRLKALAGKHQKFAVIGGGFIGSEIAAALSMEGKDVTIVFPEEGVGARLLPADLSNFMNDYYREKGVEVLEGELVEDITRSGDTITLKTKSGKNLEADVIVAGIGIQPNVELAEAAGLEVDNGIVVDEHMRTSDGDIYAAGDVAAFHNPALGTRIRVEHEDNANTMGKQAGRAMAGEDEHYHHLPFYYSDMFDIGYEAVGEIDSRLETFADWQEEFRKGIVYYLNEGRVRGVLLWDTWGKVDEATELIAQPGPFKPDDLKERITG